VLGGVGEGLGGDVIRGRFVRRATRVLAYLCKISAVLL
jgi:hypothetical protein